MWVMTMFDLPTVTKLEKRRYTKFRNMLLDDGFQMFQYSVYGRPCPSEENAKVHIDRVKRNIPAAGQVRILIFTDLQFSRMQVFIGKSEVMTEKGPEQLSFF